MEYIKRNWVFNLNRHPHLRSCRTSLWIILRVAVLLWKKTIIILACKMQIVVKRAQFANLIYPMNINYLKKIIAVILSWILQKILKTKMKMKMTVLLN